MKTLLHLAAMTLLWSLTLGRASAADTDADVDAISRTAVAPPSRNVTYSATDLYNTANAYARQGKPGLAVLNYERAHLLAPGDTDIEANLAFVRAATGLPPDVPDRLERVLAIVARPLTRVNPDVLAATGLAGLILAATCQLILTAGRHRGQRWKLRSGVAVGLLLIAVTAADAALWWPTLHQGVVLAAATPARVSPVPMGDSLFVLQEGESVRIAATHEGFALVESRAGRMGWVAQSTLSAVVPR